MEHECKQIANTAINSDEWHKLQLSKQWTNIECVVLLQAAMMSPVKGWG
jgi:hypothetical protein